jgi:DNA mismatch endonuclease (patch repair protein)
MSGIRGKNTKPELVVRQHLHRLGFRFRVHVGTLAGKPDIVLPKHRTIVEVRGCFWHQHSGCRFAYMPKSNRDFWKKKLRSNFERDQRNDRALRSLGWRVLTVWECQVGKPRTLDNLVRRIKG